MKLPDDRYELLNLMGRRLDGTLAYLTRFDQLYAGTMPGAFMSTASANTLGGRLNQLSANYCRLAILSLVERLRIVGFRAADGTGDADGNVWASWERSGMDVGSDQAHVDAFVSGRSYVTVWGDPDYGDPLITPESARQMTTLRDPATGRVRAALKRYADQLDPDASSAEQVAVLYLPDRVETYSTGTSQPAGAFAPFGAAWSLVDSMPNPLGVVPVVPVINGYGQRVLGGPEGESELSDVSILVEAIAKTLQDAAVTSESYARPRRWVTGLEITEDDDGNPVNPFPTADTTRMFQAEHPDVKFGEFGQAELGSYVALIGKLTEMVSAVTTLPGHYLGVGQDQPPSADGIRAAEASLVARCYGKQRMLTPAWSRVAALETAVRTGRPVESVRLEPLWADPSTRTPAQSADEAVKLAGIGLPLATVLSEVLGWSPEQVRAATQAADAARTSDAVAALLTAPQPTPQPAPAQEAA